MLRQALAQSIVAGLCAAAAAPVVLPEVACVLAQAPAAEGAGKSVDAFWHYAKIARYDLAVEQAQAVLNSDATPLAILEAFESAAGARKDDLDAWMLRWTGVKELSDVSTSLIAKLTEGHLARRADPTYIDGHIRRLAGGERAYMLAIARLRESGELAVPLMLRYLRDPDLSDYHPAVRRGIKDLGRTALAPLSAATEMSDAATLATVATLLGELGYADALPYLVRLAGDSAQTSTVRSAAANAAMRLGSSASSAGSSADLFYALAEKYFYDKATVFFDDRNPAAFIWYWDEQRGLVKRDVPPSIYNELMAMRCCEYAMKLGGGGNDALSLWLSANYRREAHLPLGAADPTRQENQPDADYYGVSAGAQYLDAALARALRDGDTPVAFAVTRSLAKIAGPSNQFAGGAGALADAMAYQDRLVRFEAALAVAKALPQQPFAGQDRVVPLLAEALAQTGKPVVAVVMPTQDELNGVSQALRDAGAEVVGATSVPAALAAAAALPALEGIVVSEQVGEDAIVALLDSAANSVQLRSAARVVITTTSVSPYEARKMAEPLLGTTQQTSGEGLMDAIRATRLGAGAIKLDAEGARDYALRAADALSGIASGRGQVLDLAPARGALLAALGDGRAAIVTQAGRVLAMLNDADAQSALLQGALESSRSDEVRISLLASLADSARVHGNKLAAGQVDQIQQAVATEANLAIRSAAAAARGALNLDAQQARTLIVEQARF